MNRLPMSFDWRAAKQNGNAPMFAQNNIFRPTNYESDVKGSSELTQSLMMHIQNQVKTTTDIDGYAACGKNPYIYVVNKFVNPMLLNYLMMHKIDSASIMYIATSLKQDPDNAKFANASGLYEQAKEYGDHIEISPQVILKAIVDKCM